MRRLALLLQYDGSAFAGSQRQPDLPTVQAALEEAIRSLTGEASPASFAGRTDAGVHATGQVASFTTSSAMPAARFARGLNHFLPPCVAVQAARDVAESFDPRRCAVSRVYRYEIVIARQRQPLREARAWIVPPPFDLERGREAAAAFAGEHDFAAFAKAGPEGSTRRTVRSSELLGEPPEIVYRVEADSFLQRQVRRMAGAIVETARGKSDAAEIRRLLTSAAPGRSKATAPAGGLTLAKVRYDGSDLPDWTELDDDTCTRRVRR